MAKRGRKPKLQVEGQEVGLPKKETELHRQMRATWLALPPEQRTFREVARVYGVSSDSIENAAKAFNWLQDAAARDSAIVDPFVEQHQTEIDSARLKTFRFLCQALENEMKRQSFELTDEEIIAKVKAGDLEGATKDWTAKDWMAFLKNLSMRAKDFKDFNQIVDGIRKVVFEWNPNKPVTTGPGQGGLSIGQGGINKISIHYD